MSRSKPTTVKKKSSGPKVSASLPGRAAPARHGGTQLMSRTNYKAVSDYVGHWAGLAFDRWGHFGKNPGAGLVRAWCGPGAGLVRALLSRSPTDCDTCLRKLAPKRGWCV